MAQINFPEAIENGQTFEAGNGVIYTYVGTPPNGYWSGTFQDQSLQTLDGRYLKLDSSNDPLTGGLIVNGGNVGIGTNTPAQKLHIKDSGNAAIGIQNSGSDGVNFAYLTKIDADDEFRIQSSGGATTANMTFYTGNASERMRISSTGDVGIGTNNPSAKLDINGGSLIVQSGTGNNISLRTTVGNGNDSHFRFQKSRGGVGALENVADKDDTGTISWGGYYSGSFQETSTIRGQALIDGSYSDRLIYDSSEHLIRTSNATRLTVTSNGLIGIGTDNPSALLHVRGTTHAGGILIEDSSGASGSPAIEIIGKRSDANSSPAFSGKLCLAGNRLDGAVSTGKIIGTVMFGGNHTDGSTSNILYAASIGGVAEGTFSNSSTMPTGLAFYTGPTGRTPDEANVKVGTERMRITSDGNVGIGGDSPVQKLLVRGSSNDTIDSTTGVVCFRGDGGNGLLFGTKKTNPYRSYIQSGFTTNIDTVQYDLLLNPLGGKVGIGTSAPSAKLMVRGPGQSGVGFNTSGDTTLVLADAGTSPANGGTIVFAAASGNWKFAAIRGLVTSGANNSAGSLGFYTRRATGDGTLTENFRALATGGITFNGDNTPANALEDYEEGTWTPAIQNGTFTYTKQIGTYTKVGKIVNATLILSWSAYSGTGGFSVNLPFTSNGNSSNNRYVGAVGYHRGFVRASGDNLVISNSGGQSIFNLYGVAASGAITTYGIQFLDGDSSGEFQVTITYQAA